MKSIKIFVVLIIILFVFLFVFFSEISAMELETVEEENGLSQENIIREQMKKLNLEDLEAEVARINRIGKDIIPELTIRDIIAGFVRGEFDIDWKKIIIIIIQYLGREVAINLNILGQVIVLAVFSAVLKVFNDSFSSEMISNTANMIIFLILAVLLLNSFRTAASVGVDTIQLMVNFMQALIPVLLTMLISVGAVTSAAIFHPLTYLIITALSTGINTIILPMIFISFVLTIVNNISDEFNISRLAALFKEISLSLLTLSLTLFIGSSLLQGGFAAISDSITLRTAKFLSGRFIPVIGGILSGAIELIVNCSLLIKNSLNMLGMLGILVIIIHPIIKILALIILYKIAAAVLQPICDQKLINILNTIGNNMLLILGIVIAVAFMFFIVITIIAGTANITVMMR